MFKRESCQRSVKGLELGGFVMPGISTEIWSPGTNVTPLPKSNCTKIISEQGYVASVLSLEVFVIEVPDFVAVDPSAMSVYVRETDDGVDGVDGVDGNSWSLVQEPSP